MYAFLGELGAFGDSPSATTHCLLIRYEVVKDEPPKLGVADYCHVAENRYGMWPIRGFPKVYRSFNAAGELVESDKLTVVPVHREYLVAIKGL